MTTPLWVSWPGASLAHAADPNVRTASDVRCGSFPLACGRFAPDGFDKNVEIALASKAHCDRCEKALRG